MSRKKNDWIKGAMAGVCCAAAVALAAGLIGFWVGSAGRDSGEKTDVTESTVEESTEASESEPVDIFVSETEEKEETSAESQYLEDLKELEPGTVLSPEQIDLQNLDSYFMVQEIKRGDPVFQRINGKSYRDNDNVSLESLRYLKLPHYNFDGCIQVGELVVSSEIAEDVVGIFKELFQAEYQIESMYLVDNYWTGDPDTTDTASIDVNNTSAFCYRAVTGGSKLSNHAYGKAIDLNPQQNPYVSYSTGTPRWSHSNADAYIDRDTGLPHVITYEDLAYKVFSRYGFRWGGDWNNPKDYQHFEKN